MNTISHEKRQLAIWLLRSGASLREVQRAVGIAKPTISRIVAQESVLRSRKANIVPKGTPGSLKCDGCGEWFVGQREAARRTARLKRKFCSHGCFGDFCRNRRNGDRCKRCGFVRGTSRASTRNFFIRGYCGRCYSLLRQYGFNEPLAEAHELHQALKKEAVNASADQQHQ